MGMSNNLGGNSTSSRSNMEKTIPAMLGVPMTRRLWSSLHSVHHFQNSRATCPRDFVGARVGPKFEDEPCSKTTQKLASLMETIKPLLHI